MSAVTAQGHDGQGDRIVAGKHQKIFRYLMNHTCHLRDVAGSFFYADDVGNFRQPLQCCGFNVDACSPLHAIQNNGQAGASGNGFVVLIKAFLSRLVVVRGNGEKPCAPSFSICCASSITS